MARLTVEYSDFSGGANSYNEYFKLAKNEVIKAHNCYYDGSKFTTRLGQTRKNSTAWNNVSGADSEEIRSLYYFNKNGTYYLASNSGTKAGLVNLSTYAFDSFVSGGDISLDKNGTVSFEIAKGKLYGVNGIDNNFVVSDLTTRAYTSWATTKFNGILWHNNRMWAYKNNYGSDYRPAVLWSDIDQPETNIETNLVKLNVKDGQNINAMVSYAENILIFLDNDIFIKTGGDVEAEFSFKSLGFGIGCKSPKTIINCDGVIIFLGSDGYVYALTSSPQIILKKVKNTLYDNINKTYLSSACAVYFKKKYYLYYAYGSSVYNNYAVIYDFESGRCYTQSGIYPSIFINYINTMAIYSGDYWGYMYQNENGTSDEIWDIGLATPVKADNAIDAHIISRGIDFNNWEVNKQGRYIYIHPETTLTNLKVYYGLDTTNPSSLMTIDTTFRKAGFSDVAKARIFTFKFQNNTIDTSLRFTGFDFKAEPMELGK